MNYFIVSNPSRVIPSQTRFLSLVPPQGIPEGGLSAAANATQSSPRSPRSPSHAVHTAAPSTATILPAAVPPSRYVPVDIGRRHSPYGIVMLMDSDPSQPEVVEKVRRVALGEGLEAEPPAEFEWDPNDE